VSKPWIRNHVGLLVLALSLSVLFGGCNKWSQRGAKGIGTLPPASPNETKFSSYQPARPYEQLTKGLLGRKVYTRPKEVSDTNVEVEDLLVGPNQRSDNYAFQAAAIFEVKSGTGLLKLGNNSQRIETGSVVSLPPGQQFSVENDSELAIAIRVGLLGSK